MLIAPLAQTTTTLNAMTTPSSQTLLWKYMGSIGVYTALVVGGLLAFLWLLKTKPAFVTHIRSWVGMASPPPVDESKLKVEEVLSVEADKQLMIIQCEHERFLVSSGTDGLRFLTKLDASQSSVELLQEAYEKTTHEDAAGIRGVAITPTDSGVSEAPSPKVNNPLWQGVQSLIPPAQTTLKSWNTSSSSHPPFGLK